MFKIIEKHIADRLERIMFIELKKDAYMIDSKFAILKSVPIPIHINELAKPIKEGKDANNISLASMARGMLRLIGLDSEFKYIKEYKTFLYAFDAKIVDYISYEGLKFAEEGELVDALIYFKALITLEEDNINGLYNYARICQDIGFKSEEEEKKKDFKREAVEALEIITEKYSSFSLAYYHLGFHYANQKLFKKAQLTWEKCLSLGIDEEKNGEILYQIEELTDQIQYEEGYTFILNNQPNLGIEKLVPLLEKYSNWWNLLFFIGLGYRQSGNVQEAINYLKKILTIKPTQVDTLNELGLCYAGMHDFKNAEKYFVKGLQFQENDAEILSNLGMTYMESGKFDLAREVLEKSIKINAEDEITNQCLKKLNLMECKK
ncbi:tetratricopeptide repeat protein [Marinisporobacter balticus]|uniref:Tetratricopeptide repeat protein n=1 Tax=Marinisporobacter balticus TaxID=2018667 RepID=A0A4R2L3C4_9FIRM|nr:tetratricopeptide repeat protein [Marinisporobacter balticus]TCO73615.1 tetratricopeptide repeat protein [Marinisporobacter balticus]